MELNEAIEVAKSLGLTIYDHNFGQGTYRNLEGVDPSLITVAELAIKLCRIDGTVIPGGGLRTEAQAQDNVSRGTGILNSLHRIQSSGFGHAIDLIPYFDGKPQWTLEECQLMAKAVTQAAAILSVPHRKGCDFDQDRIWGEPKEWDWCHFEKPKPQHLARAIEVMMLDRKDLGLDAEPANDDATPANACACPHCGNIVKLSA